MAILIDSAELAGLAIEGPLYGIFLCLFSVCAYDLAQRRALHSTQIRWPMALAGALLIVLSTVRFIVDVSYIFVAFVRRDTREARLAFLEDVTQPLFITKHSLFITSLLVGDLFVNYRCWVVWGKNVWVVVLPLLLAILSAGAGYYSLWGYTHLTDQSIFAQRLPLKLFFSSSLVANTIATSLLAFRIWWINRAGKNALSTGRGGGGGGGGGANRLTPVVRIVLESGLLNAAFLFAFVMTLSFGSSSLEIMSEMGTPMCGIVFAIVIFRVGLRQRDDSDSAAFGLGTRASGSGTAHAHGMSMNRFTRTSFMPPGVGAARAEGASPPTALQVFVHSESVGEQDPWDSFKAKADQGAASGRSLA